jgi:hypothetical protein
MYGGAPFGSLPYGSTFGGVIVMPEVCNTTDWAVSAVLSSSWVGESAVSSTWTRKCDGDPGTVT